MAGAGHVWAEGAEIVPSDDLERDDDDDDSYFSELVVETVCALLRVCYTHRTLRPACLPVQTHHGADAQV